MCLKFLHSQKGLHHIIITFDGDKLEVKVWTPLKISSFLPLNGYDVKMELGKSNSSKYSPLKISSFFPLSGYNVKMELGKSNNSKYSVYK